WWGALWCGVARVAGGLARPSLAALLYCSPPAKLVPCDAFASPLRGRRGGSGIMLATHFLSLFLRRSSFAIALCSGPPLAPVVAYLTRAGAPGWTRCPRQSYEVGPLPHLFS